MPEQALNIDSNDIRKNFATMRSKSDVNQIYIPKDGIINGVKKVIHVDFANKEVVETSKPLETQPTNIPVSPILFQDLLTPSVQTEQDVFNPVDNGLNDKQENNPNGAFSPGNNNSSVFEDAPIEQPQMDISSETHPGKQEEFVVSIPQNNEVTKSIEESPRDSYFAQDQDVKNLRAIFEKDREDSRIKEEAAIGLLITAKMGEKMAKDKLSEVREEAQRLSQQTPFVQTDPIMSDQPVVPTINPIENNITLKLENETINQA